MFWIVSATVLLVVLVFLVLRWARNGEVELAAFTGALALYLVFTLALAVSSEISPLPQPQGGG